MTKFDEKMAMQEAEDYNEEDWLKSGGWFDEGEATEPTFEEKYAEYLQPTTYVNVLTGEVYENMTENDMERMFS